MVDGLKRQKNVKFSFHGATDALVEGLLARGGRNLGPVIEGVYRRGGIFEAWNDRFDIELWREAAAEQGLDITAAACAFTDTGAPLPWDHINCGVSKAFLLREWELARQGQSTADCRSGQCSECGIREAKLGCGGSKASC